MFFHTVCLVQWATVRLSKNIKAERSMTKVTKNILIFSDGTGQAGGLTPDQRISNIYKLFRSTRNQWSLCGHTG